ncbi:LOW QUALITY PROTEIN: uncharacterized protein LOC119110025 [Pollicipes pollicipes]|uniref:LOW QUALITY PROTEIN: uncharacterized protein LOC119110025 n=1 Tax=Pollicipes pollicipes TaxID=41117 RepID=UPI0018855EED|nr:LOW QUALITY PROTEIN: uncharacterized protein LOC119110025 [Pollicipes pollicipes]
MPRIVSLDVQCDKSLMRVSVKFDKPFSGIIFSKGHYSNYNCVHLQPGSTSADAQFDISINACGTTGNTENGQYGYGSDSGSGTYFENTIIIQYDPQVQEVWDQARKLRCTWHNQYEKAVTFRPFPVDMLDVVRADFAGDNVGCWMQIQVGKGPWAAEVSGLVKIGQTMTMVLAIKDDDNKFDMLVRNCMAHDGKRAPIQLVDQAGCITRPKLMSKFTKIKNFGASASVLSYAHFQAFKFPDSMEVHFQCTIQICRYQCSEQCGSAIEPRPAGGYDAPPAQGYEGPHDERRVRRSAEARDVGIDRVIQVVSTRDLAFALETPAGNDTETVVFPVESDDHRICMSTPGFAATLIVLLAILVISSLLSAFLCLRYRAFGGDRSLAVAADEEATQVAQDVTSEEQAVVQGAPSCSRRRPAAPTAAAAEEARPDTQVATEVESEAGTEAGTEVEATAAAAANTASEAEGTAPAPVDMAEAEGTVVEPVGTAAEAADMAAADMETADTAAADTVVADTEPQSYDAPAALQQSYDAPQPQQSYDAPQAQAYEAPAKPEQAYEPAPAHQVAEQYGAPEAQAQAAEQGYGAPAAAQPEVWPAPAADMPRIVSLDVQCDKSLMRVSVKFDKPFSGIIFSKGHYSNYNCVHLQPGSTSADAQFDISINACGTTGNTENGQYGYGSDSGSGTYFENTIIIQYDPQVQEVWDQARKLRCTWHNQYEKAVTFRPFPVDMLDVVRADFAGDNVGCWMQIQVGKGPWAAEVSGLVKIGQTMTMVLAIKDDDNKFDMLVRNCMAHDGKRAPIQLVDQAGCITRPKLMSKFTKIKNFGASASVLSYAHFQAFKFPDSMEVHFQCTIQICRYQCSEQCGSAIEPRPAGGYDAPPAQGYEGPHDERRVRRSAEARDVGIDRVIQVVSTRDLAFALETPAGNDTETVVFPVESDDHRICMSTPGFAATLIVLLAILVISSLLSAFLCLRYRAFGGDRSVLSAFENPIFLHKKSGHF